jgi:hypothetical protein
MRTPKVTACSAMMMALVACAGRAPQPVAVVQAQDRYTDCAAIAAEVQANNQKVQELASDEGAKVAQNVAAGVAGLFIWPLWFAMDSKAQQAKKSRLFRVDSNISELWQNRNGVGNPRP